MIRSYNELVRNVKNWNKKYNSKLELYRTYNKSYKKFGNSRGFRYSIYTSEGDLITHGTIQTVIDDLLFTSYRELVI